MRTRLPRRGFTLIELLVVMSIMGVMVGLLLPAVQNARETANRMNCQNNMKQIGIGMHNYHDANLSFPPGYMATAPSGDPNFSTAPGWGWATLILPYVEQSPLYNRLADAIAAKVPITDPSVAGPIQTWVSIYTCPSDLLPQNETPFAVYSLNGNTSYPLIYSEGATGTVMAAPSSYAACVGRDEDSDADGVTGSGVFYCNSHTRLADILDGTSETILVGEKAWCNANGVWIGAIPGCAMTFGWHNPCLANVSGGIVNSPIYAPPMLVQAHAHLINATLDADGGLDDFSSMHPGGCNILFADGSVHFVASTRPDPNPGDPGAVPSPYPPPRGTPSSWYYPAVLNYMGYGTRNGGEVVTPID